MQMQNLVDYNEHDAEEKLPLVKDSPTRKQ